MVVSNLSPRIGAQHPFGTDTHYRRAGSPRVLRGVSALFGLLVVGGGCDAAQDSTPGSLSVAVLSPPPASVRQEESRMLMTVGARRFAVTLSDNAAARTFAAQLPLTLDMGELNGNEKHAELPTPLPAKASRPGTIREGDLMLYGADTLVVFYATFTSSYSYTRLGRVDDPAGLSQALGPGAVRVLFSKD
jgi:hypothetical protein